MEVPALAPLGDKKFWDFKIFPRAYKNWSEMNKKDKIVAGLILTIHAMSLGAPLTWGPGALKWLGVNYFLCLLGITASFHR